MVLASEAGLRPIEFWDMSWRELDNWVQGYERRIEDEWRRTREIVTMQYNTHVQRRGQQVRSSDMIPLPSDTLIANNTSTLPDFKSICKQMGIPWNPIKN